MKDAPAPVSYQDDTIVIFGGDVKALGDGLVGGPVIQFGTAATADRQGDFFTPLTDYNFAVSTKARIVYHHGLGKYGPKMFGIGDMKMEPDRVWASGQLDMSDSDAKAIYADVEAGKLGWSSGSVERLVKRRDIKGASEILSWPLIEISLTPTPVDRRNKAVCIKALMEQYSNHAHDAAIAAMDRLHEGMRSDVRGHMGSDKAKADRLASSYKSINDKAYKCRRVVKAMIEDDLDDDDQAMKSLFDGLVANPSLSERSEALVADAGEILGLYAKALEQREAEGRTLSPAKCAEVKAIAAGFESLVARLPDLDGARRKRALMLRARAAIG